MKNKLRTLVATRARAGALVVCGVLGVLVFWDRTPAQRTKRAIVISAEPIELSSETPGLDRLGALKFLGGLELKSAERDFGGFSALAIDPSGERLVAVSDIGRVLKARLQWAKDRLVGIDDATLAPLRDRNGNFVETHRSRDAESLAFIPGPDARAIVGFEGRHRLWSYAPDLESVAQQFEGPAPLKDSPINGGAEALTRLDDGRLLLLLERADPPSGNGRRGFVLDHGTWRDLTYPRRDGLDPVEATTLPGGDVLVMERSSILAWMRGLRCRIRRIPAGSIQPGAFLDGPVLAEFHSPIATENYEGLTAFATPSGATRLVMISDNSFLPFQKTLLLAFEVSQ